MIVDGYNMHTLALEEEVTRPLLAGSDPTITVRLWLDPLRAGFNRTPSRLDMLRRQVAGVLAGREWKRFSFDDAPELWCWARVADGAPITWTANTYEATVTLELKSAAWYGVERTTFGTGEVGCMIDGTAPTYPTIEFDAAESLVIDGVAVVVDSTKPCVWNCEEGICTDADGFVAIPADYPTPAWECGRHTVASSGNVTIKWVERWL